MIAYHGSNHNFKKFRVAKELVGHRSTMENEGLGIYFSTRRDVAESYGKYLYTIEINDNYLIDFRCKEQAIRYLKKFNAEVHKETGIYIANLINFDIMLKNVMYGGVAIIGIGREICLCLDSVEEFYQISETKRKIIFKMCDKLDRNPPKAYMFAYHISDIGVIKDVSPEVVKILDKEYCGMRFDVV